ncbi:PEP/pyruvate-binding domain-containing protein [Pontiellaceae bacterium B12219]|nr:PEP/pyruvate-binding domain-containing protein [Pontiellaceae bacterium B12219]
MSTIDAGLTTGLPGLDRILKGVLIGDNIVWQVDSIAEYRELVVPYCEAAVRNGRKLVYFRFSRHDALITTEMGAEVYEFDPEEGFENFIASIHGIIEKTGPGAFYVFDCLSRLAVDWYSDEMLGNFFMLTCPYLFDVETVAYFAIFRNYHTSRAISPILETTQLFLDVYRHKDELYVRPIKAQHRYSPTMNMLHVRHGEKFMPVTSSAVISEILTSAKWSGLHSDSSHGFWESSFLQARELLKSGEYRPDLPEKGKAVYELLVRMVISRDESMQKLIARYFTLQDILDIRKRMIGTGLIGGKAVGMLLAQAIVKKKSPRFIDLFEAQDSFFIGSDAFFSFLVRNGIWWVRQNQRDPEKFLDGAEQARRRIITGDFPAHILKQFDEMLDYFGQSPFIVRSSSLLEDNFGNSFAGKYESVFCVNQGPRERRMEDFVAAVKRIYASSMSEQALRYRARRGMLDNDEQMALLVMRVSGTMHGRYFYPEMAGVGFSFNPYAWHESIDPEAGVIRLVFGLGTRAVDQADDDYTRIVALNAPDKRPEANFDEVAQYAQRRVDYLDLEANQEVSDYFMDLVEGADNLPIEMFASIDPTQPRGAKPYRILTFDKLLNETDFVADMREILDTIEAAYNYPVDIEFTANFMEDGNYRINLLQCRPLQVHGSEAVELPEVDVADEDRIVEAHGAVVGQSRVGQIDRFIYVVPSRYGQLPVNTRHEIARLIGDINRTGKKSTPKNTMIIGPGRWGTSSPSLGIPVSFSDINTVSILCEIVAMHDNLVPDVSLGTHFLNERVEMKMLYLALFPDKGGNFLNTAFFEEAPNRLLELVPSAGKWADTVRVIDAEDVAGDRAIQIIADALHQTVSCHFVHR